MNRDQFDHSIRAAASVLGVNEILVIGSQAVHASRTGALPEAAARSVEVDIVPLDDPDGAKSRVALLTAVDERGRQRVSAWIERSSGS